MSQSDHQREVRIRNKLGMHARAAAAYEPDCALINYYDERGLMRRIDGTRSPADVNDHIRAVIATLRMEDDV